MDPAGQAPAPSLRRALKFGLFVILAVGLISLPFVVFGEAYALPLLRSQESRAWAMALVAIALLAADSVAPVPSALVIVALAAKTNWWIGTLAGTAGLTGQVLCAAWLGRAAGGRLAPRFFGEGELLRLRGSLQRRLALTLGCFRSLPVLAETSIVVASSLGVSTRRIFWATLPQNAVLCGVYSIAADDSLWTAGLAILGSIAVSLVAWRATSPGSS